MQIQLLRWRPNLHRTNVQGIILLIVRFNLTRLAVFFDLLQLLLRRLVLWLEDLLDPLGRFVDLLVGALGCGGEVV